MVDSPIMPTKPKDDNHDITLRLPRLLTKELKDLGRKEGNSMSAVTRRMLTVAVREEKEKLTKK